jgi:hypothetical protein
MRCRRKLGNHIADILISDITNSLKLNLINWRFKIAGQQYIMMTIMIGVKI